MKCKQNIMKIIILGIALFGFLGQTHAYAAQDILLKVGLQYGTIKESSSIFSDNGFVFGMFIESTFQKMIDFSSSKNLTLIKNGISENESAITSGGSTGSTKIKGKYHIQIGEIQPTYEAILPVFERVKTTVPDAFLAYDDGWRVYQGAYFTEAEFQASFAAAQTALAPYNVVRAPFNYTAFMVADTETGVVKLLFDASETDFAFASALEDGKFYFNKYKYRGAIGFKRFTTSDPTVINYVSMEEYLYGVLPYEISPKWPIEAQKAQAVAARNYAMTNINKHRKYGFDVCNTVDCQVYAGANVETALSNSAVDLTKGFYLKYNGKLAQTFFHANSGGRTENSENVWTTALPYLVGVDDPFSIGSPNDVWTVTYTPAQIKEKLTAKKYDIGDVTNVIVEQYSVNGRSLKTTIVGTKSSVSFSKDSIRSFFSDSNFKTNYFTVQIPGSGVSVLTSNGTAKMSSSQISVLSASGTSNLALNGLKASNGISSAPIQTASSAYTFNGKGWGHGVGMSQWGAKKMAELGYNYEEILTYYYQNTNLVNTN